MMDDELAAFARAWTRSIEEADLDAARMLRGAGYESRLPDGELLSADQELALLASPHRLPALAGRLVKAKREGETAVLYLQLSTSSGAGEELYGVHLTCRKVAGRWVAAKSEVVASEGAAQTHRSYWRRPADLLRRAARSLSPRPAAPRFPDLLYVPIKGPDVFVPASSTPPAAAREADLPIPPPALWTAARYAEHGAQQVETMLEAVAGSGCDLQDGDGILELGCGSGRMIRHLLPLADRCEIWGLDISAAHILWCQQNLRPPFHFATNTKVPHLPFGDASMRLVYCGSLFTHIDDLADAWLLELRRILKADGRLYVTLHDERTIELLESGRYGQAGIMQNLRRHPLYRRAVEEGFSTFALGRDHDSQVFHHSRWFSEMVAPAFRILDRIEEAYHYQTAYLLAPA